MISPHGRDLLIWMVVFTVLNLTVLGLRFYTVTHIKKRKVRPDDFLVLFSVAAMLAMEGTTFWAIQHGLGARTSTLPWSDVVVNIKLLISAFWTWTVATCACKLAILYLYLEIFSISVPMQRAIWFTMALCVAYVPTFITVFMTQCSPVSAAWDPILSTTNCRPRETHELVSVAINVALDLLVVALPIPVIWNLQMPNKKKIAVTGMFSLGLLVIGIMIWRLVTTAVPKEDPDLVYDTYLLALQSHLELWLGILAANLPSIAPLARRLKIIKWNSYNRKYQSASSGSSDGKRSVRLKSFGRSFRRHDRNESDLLTDDTCSSIGGIQKSQNFTVSIQSSHDGGKTQREPATMV
ncbi:hypothetical protein NX059_007671 [Plenodomus lindquistii]|nr:hypothetical protein NX059_007671 [Plenodomus lindquistii]